MRQSCGSLDNSVPEETMEKPPERSLGPPSAAQSGWEVRSALFCRTGLVSIPGWTVDQRYRLRHPTDRYRHFAPNLPPGARGAGAMRIEAEPIPKLPNPAGIERTEPKHTVSSHNLSSQHFNLRVSNPISKYMVNPQLNQHYVKETDACKD